MRTIDWVDGEIHLIDQTRLPGEVVVRRVSDVDGLIEAIRSLAVRGAPALGVAGAMGVALRRPVTMVMRRR
jgi:methylthioribose-1-phosphate isomerase